MKLRWEVGLALLVLVVLGAWLGCRARISRDAEPGATHVPAASGPSSRGRGADVDGARASQSGRVLAEPEASAAAEQRSTVVVRAGDVDDPLHAGWLESEIVICVVDELGRAVRGSSVELRPQPQGFEEWAEEWLGEEPWLLDAAPSTTPRADELGGATTEDPSRPAAGDFTGCHGLNCPLATGTVYRTVATIRAWGFEPLEAELVVVAGEDQRATYVLTRMRPEIGGRVVDERGAGLAGLALELHGDPTHAVERATSDVAGSFEFPATRRRDARVLRVFRGQNLVATVAPEKVGLGMEVLVADAGSVRGRLFEERGGLVPRARVQLSAHRAGESPTWFGPHVVTASGEYELLDAPSGALVLNVWLEAAPGHWRHVLAQPFELGSGESRVLDVVVPALP